MNAVVTQDRRSQSHATLSAIVAGINAKRSAELRLLNSQGWNVVGNVTIPRNQPVPAVGAVVEVQHCLIGPSEALNQPRYLWQRRDIEQHECIMAQLTYGLIWRLDG
jgi:bifunctional non-homologous end joining protein LigD